ncbi:ammonium transporter [Flavicella sediminum]|uniref:ammonium transporter n=1 Tax=Flavicella sediminum TaxID=2585141 RepID=UPI0011238E0A|nr:ammonium transporter [Flavicella sediminum]
MKKIVTLSIALLTGFSTYAGNEINSGDTAWMLMSTALVMMMTPAGLALFYSGLTQNKSVLNTIGMSFVSFCTGILAWVILGYSLAFAEGNAFIGGFDYFLLNGISPTDTNGAGIPKLLDVMFQGTFAAIAIAIVSGAIIERIKFSTWIIFSFFWVLVVYAPVCHWVWGSEGFLHGDLDFAGGTVIHVNAGVAGLVLSLLLGKRLHLDEERKPSSIKLMILGAALLWFGWHGFNGGSAYAANGIAASAILTTNVAACIGGLVWLIIEWKIVKKPTLIGVASGAVSGLVAITPAAGYVDVSGALAIGAIGSLVGYWGVVKFKSFTGHDDTLDAFGMHGLVGIAGAILTGVFATSSINPDGAGWIDGNPWQVLKQLNAVGATIVYSAIGTYVVFVIASKITGGARIHKKHELEGMDISYHGESQINIDKHNIDDL